MQNSSHRYLDKSQPLPRYLQGARSHVLDGKTVQWSNLIKLKIGKSVDYYRTDHHGRVVLVSSCGNIALVQIQESNQTNFVEVEVPDLTAIA